jgi:hypothetical protein
MRLSTVSSAWHKACYSAVTSANVCIAQIPEKIFPRLQSVRILDVLLPLDFFRELPTLTNLKELKIAVAIESRLVSAYGYCVTFPTSLTKLSILSADRLYGFDLRLPSLRALSIHVDTVIRSLELPALESASGFGFYSPNFFQSVRLRRLRCQRETLRDEQLRYLTDLRSLECKAIETTENHSLPFLEVVKFYCDEIVDCKSRMDSLCTPRLTMLAVDFDPGPLAPSPVDRMLLNMPFLQRLELSNERSCVTLPIMPNLTSLKLFFPHCLVELVQPSLLELYLELTMYLTRLDAEKLTHLENSQSLTDTTLCNLPSLRSLQTNVIVLSEFWSQLTYLHCDGVGYEGVPETPLLEKLVISSPFHPPTCMNLLSSNTKISSLTLSVPKFVHSGWGLPVEMFTLWLKRHLSSLTLLRVLRFKYEGGRQQLRYDYGCEFDDSEYDGIRQGLSNPSFRQLMFHCTESLGIVWGDSSS